MGSLMLIVLIVLIGKEELGVMGSKARLGLEGGLIALMEISQQLKAISVLLHNQIT
jgi:hypothetical protein